MKNLFYFISLIFIFVAPQLLAADKAAVISRDTELFSKPFKDAETITELSTQTAIIILKRKGGWYQIKTDTKQGWVRLTHVRLARKNKAKQDAENNVGEILSGLATGREKSDQTTTATAVKGLSEEELRNAEADVDALNALDNFAVDEKADNESGLQTRKIDYLASDGPAPKQKATNNNEEEDEL